MSTRLTELPLPFSGARTIPWRAFLIAFALTGLAFLLFVGSFALGLTSLNAGRVVPGTVVDGVPLGGLDRAAAEVRLREQLAPLSTGHLSVRFGAVTSQITYQEVGRDYDLAAMLEQAYAVGHSGDLLGQAQEQLRVSMRGATVEPRVKWNEAALEAR